MDVAERTDLVFAMVDRAIIRTSQMVDLVGVWAAIAHDEALTKTFILQNYIDCLRRTVIFYMMEELLLHGHSEQHA